MQMIWFDDGETMEELEELYVGWRLAFEGKGLKVNIMKTKVFQASGGRGVPVEMKEDPSDECAKRVKQNSIECARCKRYQ